MHYLIWASKQPYEVSTVISILQMEKLIPEHFYLLYYMTQEMANSINLKSSTIWGIYAQM